MSESATKNPHPKALTRSANGAPLNGHSSPEVLDETSFLRMLCLERKRTERSSRRFVLMLLESGRLLKSANQERVPRKVLDALSHSTRETDIKGWYKDGSVIGVIFTEIGPGDGTAVASILLNRVTHSLRSTLTAAEVNEIRLSCHLFPEDSLKNGSSGPGDLPLYPDLGPDMDRRKASRILKRSMDIAGSLSALIVLFPLVLLLAVIIKLTSKGPVFFRQKRVGQYGNWFTFLKFRSMYVANDHTIHQEFVKQLISGNTGSAFKLTKDPRVTSVGRLLRRTSLDELPQFLNVLKGEMSLVGPRPPIPYEFDCYDTWHRRRLLMVKPGITGLWQVGGRSRVTFDEMVRLDLKYAKSWSLWLDIKILWRTPAAVVSGEGAY